MLLRTVCAVVTRAGFISLGFATLEVAIPSRVEIPMHVSLAGDSDGTFFRGEMLLWDLPIYLRGNW